MKCSCYKFTFLLFTFLLILNKIFAQTTLKDIANSKFSSLYMQITGVVGSKKANVGYTFKTKYLLENNYFYHAYYCYVEKEIEEIPNDYVEGEHFLNRRYFPPVHKFRNIGVGIGKIEKLDNRVFLSYSVGLELTNFYKGKLYNYYRNMNNYIWSTTNYYPVYTRYSVPGLCLNSQLSWQKRNRFFSFVLDANLLINPYSFVPYFGLGSQFRLWQIKSGKNIYNN